MIPELEGQGFYELFDRVYQTGEPFYAAETEAWAHYAGNGELQRRYYRTTFEPIRDAQGEVSELLNFAVDVTAQVEARRQVEQLNQELEARVLARTQDAQAARAEAEAQYGELRRVFEQAPVAIAVFRGPAYVLDVVNPRMAAMWRRAQAELLGRPFFAALPELEGQGLRELLDEVQRTGTPFAAQEMPVHLAYHQAGQPGYYDFVYQPLRDEQGRVVAVTCIATDVTEKVLARRQNETLQAEALAAAQRQVQERATLYQIFEETPALICILRGPEHRYDYFNPTYQRQFAARQLAARPVAEALPETVEQGFIALMDKVYQTGETYFGQELLLAIEATADAPAQANYFNLTYQAYHEGGQIVGICVFAYLVTEQVRARRQNEALQTQVLAAAQRRAQERETFFKVFEQTPALIALLRSPSHRFEYVNQAY